jgi:LacI family transcriptional regulator
MKRLTLEEVGKLAGVSRATVSRVINTPENVSPELRARVQRVIAETGYQPNLAARSLVSRRSNIIGLFIPSVARILFTDPYFFVLIHGVSQACNAHAYTLSLFIIHSREEEQQVYQNATGTSLIDGLIIKTEHTDDPYIARLLSQRIPFVYIGRPREPAHVNFVDADNVGGAALAVTHLLQLGRQRIATILPNQKLAVGPDRLAGYTSALEQHGHAVDERLIAYGDFSRRSGYRAMWQLLAHRPDAVFVASDMMALGAIQAIRAAGLRIPDDIALVGFDDLPHAATADPPLTTIRQPITRTGTVATQTLFDILDRTPETPQHIILPVELVIRASCGA